MTPALGRGRLLLTRSPGGLQHPLPGKLWPGVQFAMDQAMRLVAGRHLLSVQLLRGRRYAERGNFQAQLLQQFEQRAYLRVRVRFGHVLERESSQSG